jgi:hypothetical protein
MSICSMNHLSTTTKISEPKTSSVAIFLAIRRSRTDLRLGERIRREAGTKPLYCITVNIKPFGGTEESYCTTVTTMHKNSCLNLYVRKTHEIHKGISRMVHSNHPMAPLSTVYNQVTVKRKKIQ